MKRRPAGSTIALRIKCLHVAVREAFGAKAAQRLLERAGVDEELIADETRPVPLELWHQTLIEAAALRAPGQGSLSDWLTRYHTAPELLAGWARVLRGARTPADAFAQIDQLGGDLPPLDRWTALSPRSLGCRGHGWMQTSSHRFCAAAPEPRTVTPALAVLVNEARQAELQAVPQLFGWSPARARQLISDEPGRVVYEARWMESRHRVWAAFTLAGTSSGALWASALWASAPLSARAAFLLWLTTIVLAGLVGWMVEGEWARRRRARAQMLRICALERAAELRDRRDQAAPPFETGSLIAGQYRLGTQLGYGAAGTIWEAVRLGDGCLVALKLPRSAIAHDSLAVDRLRREADALGLTWHPHVVEAVDSGQLPTGIAYLVMERLYGESLADRLSRVGRLIPEELLPIALQACEALEAVHAAGIVHRDIKPTNLFLSRQSGRPHLKLIDFGIAQVTWAETRLTLSGMPVGTPGYIAPEQDAGRVVDGRADLFSLGCVFYECLSGRPPPLRAAEMPVGQPPRLDHLDELGGEWKRLVRKLMAPWPQQRFADARSLRRALMTLRPPTDELSGQSTA